jgi:hypothetical protein
MTEQEKEIALRVAQDYSLPYSTVAFAEAFLAAVDAERGKEAVGFFYRADSGLYRQAGDLTAGTSHLVPLYLSPRKEECRQLAEGITRVVASFDTTKDCEGDQVVYPKVTVWFAEDDWASRDKFKALIAAAPTPEEV